VSRRVRKIAFYGFLGSGNLGNDASLETVLAWFRGEHPQVELRCITLAPEVVQSRYGLRGVALAAPARGMGSGRVTWTAGRLLGRLIDVPRSFYLAGSVDAVIVPGMGVLEEQLGVRPWGLPAWMLLLAVACRLLDRPFVLLAVGAEPVKNPVTRRFFVWTAHLASDLSYRDRLSEQAMAKAGARVPEAVAPDIVFGHPLGASVVPEPDCVVVGVIAYYGRHDDPVRGARLRDDYVATLTRALVQLVDSGDRIVLVGGDRVDTDVARRVRIAVREARPELPGDRIVVRAVETFDALADQMARADVVIASRFHNLICALKLSRPTISIGYAEKSAQLMNELGLGEYCQDIEHLDAERLVAQVRRVRGDQASVVATINSGIREYGVEVETLLERAASEALGLRAIDYRGDRS
jgi:polysaccharide pyruvyl transferase WcaK-like protein